MEFILSWVKSGLLFGIFASVILMLSPNKSYMKHIGMVVGLLFILVMLHPLMEFFHLDSSTYASYIKNFLMIETESDEISDTNLALYEESVNVQLQASLRESGYPVNQISVKAEHTGDVERVTLIFDSEMENIENLELYLKNLFGEDVRICYEYE